MHLTLNYIYKFYSSIICIWNKLFGGRNILIFTEELWRAVFWWSLCQYRIFLWKRRCQSPSYISAHCWVSLHHLLQRMVTVHSAWAGDEAKFTIYTSESTVWILFMRTVKNIKLFFVKISSNFCQQHIHYRFKLAVFFLAVFTGCVKMSKIGTNSTNDFYDSTSVCDEVNLALGAYLNTYRI